MKNNFGSILKYLVFLSNLLVLIGAGVCLGFGIYALVRDDTGIQIVTERDGGIEFETASSLTTSKTGEIVLTVVSGIAFVLAFLGCFGALKENRLLIFLYFVVVVFLMLFSQSASDRFRNKHDNYDIKSGLYESLAAYEHDVNNTGAADITQAWDEGQEYFLCCGVNSYLDWSRGRDASFPDSDGNLVPRSCCSGLTENATEIAQCQRRPYDETYAKGMSGCYDDFADNYKGTLTGLAITAQIFALAMVLNVIAIFAFGLMLTPKNAYQSVGDL